MFGDNFGFGTILATATGNDIFNDMGLAAEAIDEAEYDDDNDAPFGYDEWGEPITPWIYDEE